MKPIIIITDAKQGRQSLEDLGEQWGGRPHSRAVLTLSRQRLPSSIAQSTPTGAACQGSHPPDPPGSHTHSQSGPEPGTLRARHFSRSAHSSSAHSIELLGRRQGGQGPVPTELGAARHRTARLASRCCDSP